MDTSFFDVTQKEVFSKKISHLIKKYRTVSSIRSEILFSYFLPNGYMLTALSCVQNENKLNVIYSKIILGMIITLYDDLADHPKHRNSLLLENLYRLNLCQTQENALALKSDQNIFELAKFLFCELETTLKDLPRFEKLKLVLQFDIEQFYNSNRYSMLISQIPECAHVFESKVISPHNMGIVAAGTIDLMSAQNWPLNELGQCRKIFHIGQRLGRISNLVHTLHREIQENDGTNEIIIALKRRGIFLSKYKKKLKEEFNKKIGKIKEEKIESFSSERYADGLMQLEKLHFSLQGKI